jgi:F0F1-type ATP synthase delta subunit
VEIVSINNKELSIQVIINMMLINNNLLDYLITNNKFYDFEYNIWKKIEYLYSAYNDVFLEIFDKFTIKQQQQIRVKELMEDDSLHETIKYFQIISH